MTVYTRAALRADGFGSAALQCAVRRGELVRLARDRYAAGPRPVEETVAAPGSGVALRGLSAARTWGLPVPADRVEAQVRHGSRRPALPPGVELRSTRCWEVVERSGVLVTDLARTCADVACEQPVGVTVCALDAALHAGLDEAAVRARLGPGVAGADRARAALALADGRSESPLESRLRLLLVDADLPPAQLQHVVRDRDGRAAARPSHAAPRPTGSAGAA